MKDTEATTGSMPLRKPFEKSVQSFPGIRCKDSRNRQADIVGNSIGLGAVVKNGKTKATQLRALKNKVSQSAPAPLDGARFMSPASVMKMLNYSDRSAFWAACHAASIPFIRINQRRCVFEESAVRAWLDSRTVGMRSRGGEAA